MVFCIFFSRQNNAPEKWWADKNSKCKKCKHYKDCTYYSIARYGKYIKKELKLGKEKL